jgi:hypothetical protein
MLRPFKAWTSPDGLVSVEIDADGCWLRTREHPADMWKAPIEMLTAGGHGTVTVGNAPEDNQEEIDRDIARHEQAIFEAGD